MQFIFICEIDSIQEEYEYFVFEVDVWKLFDLFGVDVKCRQVIQVRLDLIFYFFFLEVKWDEFI